jgi:hypothetical protein
MRNQQILRKIILAYPLGIITSLILCIFYAAPILGLLSFFIVAMQIDVAPEAKSFLIGFVLRTCLYALLVVVPLSSLIIIAIRKWNFFIKLVINIAIGYSYGIVALYGILFYFKSALKELNAYSIEKSANLEKVFFEITNWQYFGLIGVLGMLIFFLASRHILEPDLIIKRTQKLGLLQRRKIKNSKTLENPQAKNEEIITISQ